MHLERQWLHNFLNGYRFYNFSLDFVSLDKLLFTYRCYIICTFFRRSLHIKKSKFSALNSIPKLLPNFSLLSDLLRTRQSENLHYKIFLCTCENKMVAEINFNGDTNRSEEFVKFELEAWTFSEKSRLRKRMRKFNGTARQLFHLVRLKKQKKRKKLCQILETNWIAQRFSKRREFTMAWHNGTCLQKNLRYFPNIFRRNSCFWVYTKMIPLSIILR